MRLVLARHAHALTNATDRISSTPPGQGLSEPGVEEAVALGATLSDEPISLGVSTRLRRTQETLELALHAREVPRMVLPGLDEIGFGSFEGGPLAAYREWAWSHEPEAPCPGGGESRARVAERVADALDSLLAQPEEIVLAVSHSLPIRYVLDASAGRPPVARVVHVRHASPHTIEATAVRRAADTLRAWASAPRFADTPS